MGEARAFRYPVHPPREDATAQLTVPIPLIVNLRPTADGIDEARTTPRAHSFYQTHFPPSSGRASCIASLAPLTPHTAINDAAHVAGELGASRAMHSSARPWYGLLLAWHDVSAASASIQRPLRVRTVMSTIRSRARSELLCRNDLHGVWRS